MKLSVWIPAALSAAVLAACGGGGSDSPAATTPPVVTPPSSLSLTGVAATGAAIANKTVSAKCVSGTGTATSAADGSYSISITNGTLPCVLQVTPDGGTPLFSVATGSGSTATANITPVTQLVVARLTGADPAAFYAGFGSTTTVSATQVTAAVDAVVATLASAGVTLDPTLVLTGTLVPATGTTTGSAYDQALDALADALAASGTTLDTLSTTVAATSPAATTPTSTSPSGVASLPADLLLQPAAANCPALRSGSYRYVHPRNGAGLSAQYGTLTIDAAALAVTEGDVTRDWAATDSPCRYTADNGLTDVVVSQAGVVVLRKADTSGAQTVYRMAMAFPVQSHTLAELEGTWAMVGIEHDVDTRYVGSTAVATFSATGTLSNVRYCQDAATWNVTDSACQDAASTDVSHFVANEDGGYDAVEPDGFVSGRTFAYRAGGGELMMVNVDDDGSFEVRTRLRSVDLPAVGRVNTSWDLFGYSNNQLLSQIALSQSTNTVSTVDAAAGSYVRTAKTVGGTDEHLETVTINNPRNGYSHRDAATVTGTDGTTVVNVAEWTNLSIRGMGFSAQTRTVQKRFLLSVQQPS